MISKYTIYDWLANVDYYLTATSTSIFEAEAMGVVPMVVNIPDYPNTFKTYGLDNYHTINSLLEFNDEAINKAKVVVDGKQIYNNYIAKSDGTNTQNVARVINEVINSNSTIKMLKLPYQPQDIWHKMYKLYARIMLRLNMPFMLLKRSESYVLRNEFPSSKKNKQIYKTK